MAKQARLMEERLKAKGPGGPLKKKNALIKKGDNDEVTQSPPITHVYL